MKATFTLQIISQQNYFEFGYSKTRRKTLQLLNKKNSSKILKTKNRS